MHVAIAQAYIHCGDVVRGRRELQPSHATASVDMAPVRHGLGEGMEEVNGRRDSAVLIWTKNGNGLKISYVSTLVEHTC